jgi:hypothetical protein
MKAGTGTCPITPTDVRDPDAQAIVDQYGPAQDAAFNERQGANLSGVSIFIPPGPIAPGQVAPPLLAYISATQQGKPALEVTFPDNRPLVRTMVTVPRANHPLTELSDLSVGPARVVQAAADRYPDAMPTALGLSRQDCQLVWAVAAVTGSQFQSIIVNNQGQVLRMEDAPRTGR